MKSAQDRPPVGAAASALNDFTPAAIAEVKDFTARKTLEQAHAFASGLLAAFQAPEGEAGGLARALAGVGVSLADAEQIAGEGASLVAMMADRDRKAEVHRLAAAAAADSERALYDRLSSFARLLRLKLGPNSPALATFGVPAELEPRSRRSWRPLQQD